MCAPTWQITVQTDSNTIEIQLENKFDIDICTRLPKKKTHTVYGSSKVLYDINRIRL